MPAYYFTDNITFRRVVKVEADSHEAAWHRLDDGNLELVSEEQIDQTGFTACDADGESYDTSDVMTPEERAEIMAREHNMTYERALRLCQEER